jgi:hypothetical protein
VTAAPATNISTKKKTSAAGGATLKNRFCHAPLETGSCGGSSEGTMSERGHRTYGFKWHGVKMQHVCTLDSQLTRLDSGRVRAYGIMEDDPLDRLFSSGHDYLLDGRGANAKDRRAVKIGDCKYEEATT